MSREIVIHLDAKKAKKLYEALTNRTYDKLTKARADALEEFMCDLGYEIEMLKVERAREW